jgi:hypothetical protein
VRRTTALISASALAIAGGITGTVIWLSQPSYDDMVKDCQKAIDSTSTKTDRPGACKDLNQEDYDLLLMHWAMQNAIEGMPQKDQDLLDYHDDGELNGSIGGE